MKAKSEVINFGVGVIFPDLVSQSERILKALEEQPGHKVYVLHYEERALSADETFLLHRHINLSMLSQISAGYDGTLLEKALKILVRRMKQCQHNPVGLIAFDNTSFLDTFVIESLARDVMTLPHKISLPFGFDCITGESTAEYRKLFSPESWELIEQKAREYAELPC